MNTEQIDKERELFEAWYMDHFEIPDNKYAKLSVLGMKDGKYQNFHVAIAFDAWLSARMESEKWLNVEKDGPPQDGKLVLFTDGYSHEIGYWDGDWISFVTESGNPVDKVRHWRPLPAFPDSK